MPDAVQILISATINLIEGHARQDAREQAVARAHRRIVKLLRRRWRVQKKLVLDHNALRNLFPREAIDPEITSMILRALLPGAVRAALQGLVSETEVEIFDKALRVAIGGGAFITALELERTISLGRLGDFERQWIRDHGFTRLAPDIDATTVDRLKRAVSEVYQGGGTYEQLVQTIKDTFDGFTEDRADLIAQTELNAAYNQGGLEVARQVGAKTKFWNPLGDNVCPICVGNAGQGKIPVDDMFQGGVESPPQHPRCNCVLDFGFL